VTNSLSLNSPNAGTQGAVTVTCPSGLVTVGGGGQVTTDATNKQSVQLLESIPASGTVWQATGIANTNIPSGKTMQVKVYAVCSQ
jgi:hypothetical protein